MARHNEVTDKERGIKRARTFLLKPCSSGALDRHIAKNFPEFRETGMGLKESQNGWRAELDQETLAKLLQDFPHHELMIQEAVIAGRRTYREIAHYIMHSNP